MTFDPTDPVWAAFHATVVQGGYSTPEIEAGRMKTDIRRATNRQLIAWAEQASVPIPDAGDGSREDLQQRLCDRIDANLAAFDGPVSTPTQARDATARPANLGGTSDDPDLPDQGAHRLLG